MELRQLRYFVTVVEEANFTRAAARLHLTQPGLSAQIRQLERELGQPLLDRSGRSITPTAAGAAVLPQARAALAAAQRISQTVDEFTGLVRGHVRVGLISGAAYDEFDVAGVLTAFHRDHPQVAISLTEDTTDRMLAAVTRGDLDIALIGLSGEPDPALGVEIVLDTRINAVVAVDDAEFGDRTTLSELRDRPLISLTRGTGIRGVLEHACAAVGFAPRIEFEAAAPALLIKLAAGGLGIAIVPDIPPAQAAAAGVRTVEITDPELRGRLGLVWHARGQLGPAAKVLLGQLRIALGRELRTAMVSQ
ncbi:LysR family transcriptional regulator [Nocardia sp. NEAU-G5]|uniref:LysR family transcriptional regulator n=1 Tax=Nocardia albiluteola TaxID=2842303 RepID=A0ABS6B4R9_9NOCA|nr:LysR family transcriptional regulator [Nocardia albiluteola]MBU3064199.1 LysR family transcriptional regulator [Nocardia albiluteola]